MYTLNRWSSHHHLRIIFQTRWKLNTIQICCTFNETYKLGLFKNKFVDEKCSKNNFPESAEQYYVTKHYALDYAVVITRDLIYAIGFCAKECHATHARWCPRSKIFECKQFFVNRTYLLLYPLSRLITCRVKIITEIVLTFLRLNVWISL